MVILKCNNILKISSKYMVVNKVYFVAFNHFFSI
jgi:hypothetical protein